MDYSRTPLINIDASISNIHHDEITFANSQEAINTTLIQLDVEIRILQTKVCQFDILTVCF